MSMTIRFRSALLGLAVLSAAAPAAAQMDPRLQTTVSDLLDVYKVQAASPELLTVYDFSGSMHAVYWSKAYFVDAKQMSHNAKWDNMTRDDSNGSIVDPTFTGGDFPGIVPAFDKNGYIYMLEGNGYNSTSPSPSNTNYINSGTQPTQFAVDGLGHPTAQLVDPSGAVITINHATTYTNKTLYPLVEQASHIRVTATANVILGGVSKSVTRTIDLPLPWAILDTTSTATGTQTPLKVSDQPVISPLPAGHHTHPLGSPVDPDHLYTYTNGGAAPNVVEGAFNPSKNNGANNSFFKIGRLHYNKDYLWWVFFGTDIRNSTNNGSNDTGKFVIPAYSDSLGATYEPTAANPAYSITGTYPTTVDGNAGNPLGSWRNGLGSMTRFQALKYATMSAWFANQDKVWWGCRYLDGSEELTNNVNTDNGNASGSIPDRNINLFRPVTAAGSIQQYVQKFIDFAPVSSTPLTYAFANAYAQLALRKDPSSSFGTDSSGNGQSGTESPIPACRKSFVVVFTDGIANDGYTSNGDGTAIGSADPYSAGTEALGNTAVNTLTVSHLNPSTTPKTSSMFNPYTIAGIAAHYPTPPSYTALTSATTYPITSVMPFRITDRGATTSAPRKIRTMTVAMSVAGSTLDAASGKADLYRAALYGNPDAQTWNLNTPPFDPSDPASDPTVNPFFFDATDITALNNAMTAVLAEVTAGSASIAAPASPLVGLSLGSQAYLGLFQTVKGPRWKGDLLMTGLYVGAEGVTFVDDSGNPVTNVTDQNAIWSANQNVFLNKNRTWKTRRIFTNLPQAANLTGNTGPAHLEKFDESNSNITQAIVGAPDAATRLAYIRFMRGAETAAEVSPSGDSDTTPRNDIMGDIINSSPTVLEYPIAALTGSVSPKLATLLGSVPSSSTPHFRLIFAGDNGGMLHAFGELSWTTSGSIPFTTTDPVTGAITTTSVPAQIAHGDVDEVWAFIPGEYLKSINQLRTKTNPHRYMVDGTPTVYFKDVPAAGAVRGNGVVDGNDVVRVIIGERKGGRSYYAFDFKDLDAVVNNSGNILAWKVVPDEILNGASGSVNVIRHMGFAYSNPAVGRVDTNAGNDKDFLFFGGGLSTQKVDAAFLADVTYPDATPTKLGRSLIAFDVAAGPSTNLRTWNFNDGGFTAAFGAMGAVAATVQPLEFFPGSGHTQRVYFADTPTDPNATSTRGGGVWCLGSTTLAPENNIIRKDSSNIDSWTSGITNNATAGIRHIFQAPIGWSITTTPNPFLLSGPYPVIRAVDPKAAPVAVGISFGTGDRNDPVDNDSINPVQAATNKTNFINVIFDRQDSASVSGVSGLAASNLDKPGIQQGYDSTTGDVADLTTVSAFTGTFNGYSVNPGDPAYYLKQKVGYKLNMGAATAGGGGNGFFYPKVITNTVVLNGVLFFSDFLPSSGSNACQGTGLTNTYRICNVLQPTFNSGGVTASSTTFNGSDPNCTGIVLTYPNLPGEITALGTAAVIQSGQGSTNGQPGTIDNAGAKVGGSFGKTSGFGFKPRSWRIIR